MWSATSSSRCRTSSPAAARPAAARPDSSAAGTSVLSRPRRGAAVGRRLAGVVGHRPAGHDRAPGARRASRGTARRRRAGTAGWRCRRWRPAPRWRRRRRRSPCSSAGCRRGGTAPRRPARTPTAARRPSRRRTRRRRCGPPGCASASPLARLTASATETIRRSPASWPKVSFTCLSRLMSASTIVTVLPVGPVTLQRGVQPLVDRAAVGEAGQRVGEGQPLDARHVIGLHHAGRHLRGDGLGEVEVLLGVGRAAPRPGRPRARPRPAPRPGSAPTAPRSSRARQGGRPRGSRRRAAVTKDMRPWTSPLTSGQAASAKVSSAGKRTSPGASIPTLTIVVRTPRSRSQPRDRQRRGVQGTPSRLRERLDQVLGAAGADHLGDVQERPQTRRVVACLGHALEDDASGASVGAKPGDQPTDRTMATVSSPTTQTRADRADRAGQVTASMVRVRGPARSTCDGSVRPTRRSASPAASIIASRSTPVATPMSSTMCTSSSVAMLPVAPGA